MAFGNNVQRTRRSADTYRKELIATAQATGKVIDFLTFDLSSYFRVQYVVMFALGGVPFSLREFLVATYYQQKIKGYTYAAELSYMCPHIRKTTIKTLIDGVYVVPLGKKKVNGTGRPIEAFTLTGYWEARIEIALREAQRAIIDSNGKARKKAAKNAPISAETEELNSADISDIFEEYDEL